MVKILFCPFPSTNTIAELLPEVYMGYMSVLITEVNIVTLHRRRRLFSMEWSVTVFCLHG